jgi:phenylalanyl-tRNA synthetase beta chain
MQFPESWLREFCNPPLNSTELAELLTMSGFEVEEMRPVAPPFSKVVVAEIIDAQPHPNADKLRVCKVNIGAAGEGALQIVCGAPNARVGLRAPLALVGAQLPPAEEGGAAFEIKVGKLRGVESFGMLCSARELKLGDEHGGLLELAADAPVGQDIREHLLLDDMLFTLKLTPNLGHALSVYGIARELSALTGSPLRTPACPPVPPTQARSLPVKVEASDLCGRFSGRTVLGVNPQAVTPEWMTQRLARCGQRSVSALVDISNYVMFELGRPSHIFDLDKIHEGLTVRWAVAGESLKLLNGNTVGLDQTVGVIADAQAVESLAGIMGGDATAVGDQTSSIYIEAAFWWPEAVAGRSRRYGFATDAGHRFERGVDPQGTVAHIERITQLVLDICGGEPGPMDDQVLSLPAPVPVRLRVARAQKVLGVALTGDECADVFRRMGLSFTQGETDGQAWLEVQPPSWRFDLRIEEDLIEEVIRVLGLHRLPHTPPLAALQPLPRGEAQLGRHALRHAVAALGYQETVNYSFVEEALEREVSGQAAPLRLLNPIAAPLAVMRSSLLGSLLQVLKHNLARRASRVAVFELARVFQPDSAAEAGPRAVAGLRQPLRVAGLLYGPARAQQWTQPERPVDFFDAKGDVQALLSAGAALEFLPAEHPALHPGRCAAVLREGSVIGHVGELHPRLRQSLGLAQAPMLWELDLSAVLQRPLPQAQTLPRQQPVQRDLALVLSQRVPFAQLQAALLADPEGLLRDVLLFDRYVPTQAQADIAGGEHSLAVRLSLLDEAQTLTEARIEAVVAAALARAHAACGARLRGGDKA